MKKLGKWWQWALLAAFAAALNKLYAASKAESRAGFPHFIQAAKGENRG